MSSRWSLKERPMLVGAIVLAAFVASLYVAFIASRGLPGQQHTLVTADFADIGALRPGDDVREASQRVGQVRSVEYVDGHARVVLQLDGDRSVYRDARAAVWSRSALGQKFIELDPGSKVSGELTEHEAISMSRTGPPQELDAVFNSFDAKTRQQLAGTLQEVGGGAAGHSQDLQDLLRSAPDLLEDLGTVSRSVNHDEDELVSMLRAATELSGRFAGRQQEISDLIASMDTTLRAVGVDDGAPLTGTIQAAPDALRRVRAGLDSLTEPLRLTESAMRAVRPGARALSQATPDLRVATREAVGPLHKVPGISELAGPSVGDLTQVASDAAPLAPDLGETVADARPVVQNLSPYSPEIALFFVLFGDALGDGDQAGHWLRLDLLANTESISGAVPIRDPLTTRNPYPSPGEASTDRRGGL